MPGVCGGLRIRRRYLLLGISPEDAAPSPSVLGGAINSAIFKIAGIVGQSRAELRVWRHPSDRGLYIASCRRGTVPLVLLASSLVTRIGDSPVAIDVLKSSGSIDGLIYS